MRTSVLLGTVLLSALFATQASASIVLVNTSHNNEYEQTSATTVTYAGSFFGADLVKTADDLGTEAAFSYPGPGSPQTLAPTSATSFGFQTSFVAGLDTLYPTGSYTFTLGTIADPAAESVTTTIPSTIYPVETPTLANYDAFTTLDPTQAFTVNLTGGFTAQGDESFTFFTLTDTTTNMTVFQNGFLAPGTTSFNLGANTLTAGHSYFFETIFDNRFSDTSGDTGLFNLFDTRTFGTFTLAPAAVPEPSTWAMMIGGFAMVGGTLRRRRTQATVPA